MFRTIQRLIYSRQVKRKARACLREIDRYERDLSQAPIVSRQT